MGNAIRMQFEDMRTLAFGAIVAEYTAIGAPLAHAARMLLVQNYTDALLVFTNDGVNDKFVLPAGGQVVFDIATNEAFDHGFFSAAGTTYSVARIGVPTVGSVYLSVVYGDK